MKYKKILTLLGVITILSILMAVSPLPALAAVSLTISPTSAKVGATISINGNYGSTTVNVYYSDFYIVEQAATASKIGDTITRYKKVASIPVYEDGTFTGSFTLPASLNEGSLGTVTPVNLTPGTTYYVVICNRIPDSNSLSNIVQQVAPITITPSATLDALQPASGPAGTSPVSISGGNFPASTALAFQFDGAAITATGDTTTRASGIFISTITIPAGAAAGAHTITVTAGSSTATATFTVTAPAALTVSPTTGAAGAQVAISGTNFAAGAITITFDGAAVAITGGGTQTSGGALACFITIPATATAGTHTIVVTVGGTSANSQFTVTGTPTTTPPATTTPATTTPATTTPATTTPPSSSGTVLSINQSSHAVGATIGVGGAGFTPSATVTIKYDDTQVATVKVETNGTFISPFFKAPVSKKGDHTITASDGAKIATTKFTVESTTPKVPTPLKPELGAKLKSPMIFDWQDVTDESLPVTYNLQIATDKSFGAATLLLDKTAIDSSSYTLTDTETLKLSNTAIPYYWRVKAIDAASNESEWTSASSFYAAGPFVFPRWALIASIAGGAIIIFLIGLWIGRRTAFYY